MFSPSSVPSSQTEMLQRTSLMTEGPRLCGNSWVFQQDNTAVHNARHELMTEHSPSGFSRREQNSWFHQSLKLLKQQSSPRPSHHHHV
uniref:Uncharacterized protein n=1 Tax=Amphiprion percula TaxID=161767 RepID=A0A3P8TGY3_AMPPE